MILSSVQYNRTVLVVVLVAREEGHARSARTSATSPAYPAGIHDAVLSVSSDSDATLMCLGQSAASLAAEQLGVENNQLEWKIHRPSDSNTEQSQPWRRDQRNDDASPPHWVVVWLCWPESR
jgi:hypothetical protein